MDFSVTVETADDEPHTTATVRETHALRSDEPDWLPIGAGDDAHPAPVDYLLAGLAFCQVSVLEQTLENNDVETYDIECEATVDEYGMREDHPDELPHHTAGLVEHVTVDIGVTTTPEDRETADRCLEVYDEGCIVGNSLNTGVDHTSVTSLTVEG